MDKGARHHELGLRRISFVRIDLSGSTPRAEVAGVGQHRPVTRSIPLQVAADLAAAGVPTVVRHGDIEDPATDLAEAR